MPRASGPPDNLSFWKLDGERIFSRQREKLKMQRDTKPSTTCLLGEGSRVYNCFTGHATYKSRTPFAHVRALSHPKRPARHLILRLISGPFSSILPVSYADRSQAGVTKACRTNILKCRPAQKQWIRCTMPDDNGSLRRGELSCVETFPESKCSRPDEDAFRATCKRSSEVTNLWEWSKAIHITPCLGSC